MQRGNSDLLQCYAAARAQPVHPCPRQRSPRGLIVMGGPDGDHGWSRDAGQLFAEEGIPVDTVSVSHDGELGRNVVYTCARIADRAALRYLAARLHGHTTVRAERTRSRLRERLRAYRCTQTTKEEHTSESSDEDHYQDYEEYRSQSAAPASREAAPSVELLTDTVPGPVEAEEEANISPSGRPVYQIATTIKGGWTLCSTHNLGILCTGACGKTHLCTSAIACWRRPRSRVLRITQVANAGT